MTMRKCRYCDIIVGIWSKSSDFIVNIIFLWVPWVIVALTILHSIFLIVYMYNDKMGFR